ncbi:hypothetical protein BGZ74_004513 [Mortierella antarctica]|nr:hypothetical protein BGZ74_004513 [Mortierella antarctica]
MSNFTTTTENFSYDYYDSYTRKSPKTWSDYVTMGITTLAWLCGILIICALSILFMALGAVAFLVWAVYQSLNPSTDHVLHPPIDILEVWSDRCRTGIKIIMWAIASAFSATKYDRQVRIDTLRTAQSMLLAGFLLVFLMMPLSYKVLSYGAVFFISEPPPRINNNLEETTRTEQRTDPKEHLALVQSAIDRLVKEKVEAQLQLARERAQQKQLEDLFQKYFSLAKSDPREP